MAGLVHTDRSRHCPAVDNPAAERIKVLARGASAADLGA
jgi:hypothetical protein